MPSGGAGLGARRPAPPLLAQPAQAAAPVYVALGDSYASGTGTRSYIGDGTTCQRSTKAYPSLIAAAGGYALNFRACSGAKVADVTEHPAERADRGDHLRHGLRRRRRCGLADVLTTCALPGWMSNCNGAISTAQAYINDTLPTQLSTLYAAIRTRAPYAKVVVVGYPRIFQGKAATPSPGSPREESRLNQGGRPAATRGRRPSLPPAATSTFANPTTAFIGHAVCDDVRIPQRPLQPDLGELPTRKRSLGHANG